MIAIDMTYISLEQLRNGQLTEGINIFLADMLRGFEMMGVCDKFSLITFSNQAQYVKKMFPQYKVYVVSYKPFVMIERLTHGRKSGGNLIKKWGIYKRVVEAAGFSCVWFPFATPRTAIKLHIPTVYTIHDLIEFHESKETKADKAYAKMLEQCSFVATISEYVKNDIQSSFPEIQKRMFVVPNAVEMNMDELEEVKELVGRPYILDINAFQRRKNAMTLLKAFEKIADKMSVDLVFCGGKKEDDYYQELESFIEVTGLKKRVHFYYQVSKGKRNWLLKNAVMFVTPSLSEGFGRTPIEAAMCEVSVLSSTSDSLEESTRGLVHYYNNVCDSDELAKKIVEIIETPDSKQHLALIAQELKVEYSAVECARKYWNVFKEFLE